MISLAILIEQWLVIYRHRAAACTTAAWCCVVKKTVPKGSLAEPVEEEHREELAKSGSARRWLVQQR